MDHLRPSFRGALNSITAIWKIALIFLLTTATGVVPVQAGAKKPKYTHYVAASNGQPAPISLNTLIAYIQPCCKSVFTGPFNEDPRYEFVKNALDQDPYITGPMGIYRSSVYMQRGIDYVYYPPHSLGDQDQIPRTIPYEIPARLSAERTEDYNYRRLNRILHPPTPQMLTEMITRIGHGSQSDVYLIHPAAPSAAELYSLYPDEILLRKRFPTEDINYVRRYMWASEHSAEVIKVRNPAPWSSSIQDAAQEARRDIALVLVSELCAKGFRMIEDGKEKDIVQVVHYNNNHHELERGIFRQPAISGDTAFKIAIRVEEARVGNPDSIHYLESMGFRDWQDAEHKIRLLEAFYAETHFDVIQFEKENGIPLMAGHLRQPVSVANPLKEVGFDYNQGFNAIWDAKAKVFKIIDF